ncbi:hypothetical protein [Exiguobacterium alkaliphilum]|uniref:hypothetical protein n=1 Tax=Exiguobacterium alkaliphilum TaxID=1428684 RepID=UPI001BA56E42|nr:hypothetical protein [Exiguobacterium alkaliphilum]QUE86831.1 hypothetical protein KB235_02690 [Exiguobacterium alkaliphilum]
MAFAYSLYPYSVDTILYMLLGATAVVSLCIGLLVKRVFRSRIGAYATTMSLSFVGLMLSLNWFLSAAATVFMGTIPWLLNIGFSFLLYVLFSGIVYFVIRPRLKELLL